MPLLPPLSLSSELMEDENEKISAFVSKLLNGSFATVRDDMNLSPARITFYGEPIACIKSMEAVGPGLPPLMGDDSMLVS